MSVIDIATSPVFNPGHGSAKRSVVLRAFTDEEGHIYKYVVHDRYTYTEVPVMSPSYGNGHYFPSRSDDKEPAFSRAYATWLERCKKIAEYPLAPLAVIKTEAIRTGD